jgi:hypothetical protein
MMKTCRELRIDYDTTLNMIKDYCLIYEFTLNAVLV